MTSILKATGEKAQPSASEVEGKQLSLTYPPQHWCFREKSEREERLETVYEAIGCAIALFHAGLSSSAAIQEAGRFLELRELESHELRDADALNSLERLGMAVVQPWPEFSPEAGGADVLMVAFRTDDDEVSLYIESRADAPGPTAPDLSTMTALLNVDKPDSFWELSDVAHPYLIEKFTTRELDLVRHVIAIDIRGSSAMIRLGLLGDQTPSVRPQVIMDSLLRLHQLRTHEEARSNEAVLSFVEAGRQAGYQATISALLGIFGHIDDRSVLEATGLAMKLLVYWVGAVGGEAVGEQLSHALEVLSRLAIKQSVLDAARFFIRGSISPCILLVSPDGPASARWESSGIAESLLPGLQARHWDIRLLTTGEPVETGLTHTRVLRRCDQCEVVAGNSVHGTQQYVVRMPRSFADASVHEQVALSEMFATEALAAIKSTGLRPAAIYAAGWPSALFAPTARGLRGTSMGFEEYFEETRLVYLIEPDDCSSPGTTHEDAVIAALRCSDGWGTIGVETEKLPKALQMAALETHASAFTVSVGHPVDRSVAVDGHSKARRELKSRFLASVQEIDAIVYFGISSGGTDKHRVGMREHALKLLAQTLEESGGTVAIVHISENNVRGGSDHMESKLAELRRHFPSSIAILPTDCRRIAMLGSDYALLLDATEATKNRFLSLGTDVIDDPEDFRQRMSSMLGGKSDRVNDKRAQVFGRAATLDSVVNRWEQELSASLRLRPSICPTPESKEYMILQANVSALQEGRMCRIETNHTNADRVVLYGSMNGWTSGVQMRRTGDGRFKVKLRLPKGKHWYKYLVDGEWSTDPSNPMEADADGFVNNFVTVH